MGILDKTAAELNALTKPQLVTMIADEQIAIRTDQRISKIISQSGDKRGQLEQTIETRDGNGTLISTSQTIWTYFKAGNVDTITIIEKDSKGKETSRQVVKHAESGGRMVSGK